MSENTSSCSYCGHVSPFYTKVCAGCGATARFEQSSPGFLDKIGFSMLATFFFIVVAWIAHCSNFLSMDIGFPIAVLLGIVVGFNFADDNIDKYWSR